MKLQEAVCFSNVIAGCLAALVLLLAACGDDVESVRGVITEVQPRSLTEVAALFVEDSTGKPWRFETEGPIDFTPSHLREHALTGQAITVYYRVQGDRLLAERVTD